MANSRRGYSGHCVKCCHLAAPSNPSVTINRPQNGARLGSSQHVFEPLISYRLALTCVYWPRIGDLISGLLRNNKDTPDLSHLADCLAQHGSQRRPENERKHKSSQ